MVSSCNLLVNDRKDMTRHGEKRGFSGIFSRKDLPGEISWVRKFGINISWLEWRVLVKDGLLFFSTVGTAVGWVKNTGSTSG